MTPYNARAIVPTIGKAVPLCEQPKPVKSVTVAALAANTGIIHVGGRGVRAQAGEANGLPMAGGSRPDMWTWTDIDLNQIWIDSTVANDGVSFLAWLP